ncbi:MAG: HAMP domain-containing protein [Maritimibacter sp.]|nr:HAMP domain-containing protein [Maritimibacter sp.]
MKGPTVRARLFFALAALALATFLVGAIAWAALERTTNRVDRLHGDTLSSVDGALTLSRQAAAVATRAPYMLLLDSPFRIAQEGHATTRLIEEIRAGRADDSPLHAVLDDMRAATETLVSHMEDRARYRDRTLRLNAELARMERRFAQRAAGADAPLAERQDWFTLERLAAALIGAGRAENLIAVGEFQREYHQLRLVANTGEMADGLDDLARLREIAEGPTGLFELRRLELMHQIGAQSALVRVRHGTATLIAAAEAVTAAAQDAIAAERTDTTSAISLQKSTILVVALASAALALAAALYVSGYVTGNLKAISDAMMRLAAGDRSSRLPRGEGAGDEIGKLFHAFRTFRANALRLDRSNRRLAQRTAMFDNMMRGISDGVAILSETGAIVARNDRLAEVLRIDPQAAAAHGSLEALLEAAGWPAEPGPAGADGLSGADGRHLVRRSNPLPGGGEVVLLADVTEQRQAEDRMEQARRIEALGKVTGEVAHDFGNILSTINGSLHLIDSAPPARQRELIGAIANAAEIGTALVQRLLAFARRQRLSPEAVELGPLVEAVADLVALAISDAIELKVETGPERLVVRVDPGQLESALLNLCLNAAHAIVGAGRITLRVQAAPEVALIEVADTGQGMSPEVLDHAMEPFFTARDDGSGTGLGLPMVYGFIRQSGGEMQIQSETGRGTTVRLTLPRLPAGRQERATATQVWARVLVVEDNPDDLAAHRKALRPRAREIVTATSLEAGLGRLGEGRFDLVVTDLSLGGAPGGWRIAETALESGAAAAVAVISGRLPAKIPFGARFGPALVTLPKPLDAEALAARLGRSHQP